MGATQMEGTKGFVQQGEGEERGREGEASSPEVILHDDTESFAVRLASLVVDGAAEGRKDGPRDLLLAHLAAPELLVCLEARDHDVLPGVELLREGPVALRGHEDRLLDDPLPVLEDVRAPGPGKHKDVVAALVIGMRARGRIRGDEGDVEIACQGTSSQAGGTASGRRAKGVRLLLRHLSPVPVRMVVDDHVHRPAIPATEHQGHGQQGSAARRGASSVSSSRRLRGTGAEDTAEQGEGFFCLWDPPRKDQSPVRTTCWCPQGRPFPTARSP